MSFQGSTANGQMPVQQAAPIVQQMQQMGGHGGGGNLGFNGNQSPAGVNDGFSQMQGWVNTPNGMMTAYAAAKLGLLGNLNQDSSGVSVSDSGLGSSNPYGSGGWGIGNGMGGFAGNPGKSSDDSSSGSSE